MSSNEHGWTQLPGVASVSFGSGEEVLTRVADWQVSIAPIIDERHRCACTREHCARPATQEDLRCDECRETCR